MKRRTKIVCTLGPAVDSKEKIKALIDAGMNVARLNCSHGDWFTKQKWIEWIRELSPEVAPVAILVDLQGPKFRLGEIPNGSVDVVTEQLVTIGAGSEADVPLSDPTILDQMGPNVRALLGDGEIELRVTRTLRPGLFEAKVVTGGNIKSRKGVTLVGKIFNVPAMTEKDLEDVALAIQNNVDFIALSYVKDASDIRDLRHHVEKLDPSIGICAKIETREAIKALDEILLVVDLIMVARGDMGLQMDIEEVPAAQKKIIDACSNVGKPVITATQMLESMIVNPRPTRAEATDVFNAILDGTDAVMLSGETAAGAFPIECVRTMVRIAESAEKLFDRDRIDANFWKKAGQGVPHTDAMAHAASELSQLTKPQAIVTTTSTGQTARLVSKFRPKAPILCATWNKRTLHRMAVVWGVEAVMIPFPNTTDDVIHNAINEFCRRKRLKSGDMVVVTAGVPAGQPGNTNLIMTQVVK